MNWVSNSVIAAIATTVAIASFGATASIAAPFQQVTIGGNHCFNPSTNGAPTCPTGVSTNGYLDPTTQHAHSHWSSNFGISLIGGGSTSANELRFFLQSNRGFSYASAVVADEYTIVGAPGVIPVTVTLTGHATTNGVDTGHPVVGVSGSGNFNLAIGTGASASGRNVSGVLDSQSFSTGQMTSTNPLDVNLMATHTMNVTVGSLFNLAYEFSITGSTGVEADALNTADISFTLPDGYTITSALGFGAGSTIPEPTTLLVFAAGLAGLGFAGRNRRRRR